jgi:ribokinase
MTTAWDVVVVGSVNTDYLVRGPRLPRPGETVLGGELYEGLGGKGANQAVAAARLGARVALVARVGRDGRGEQALARLRAEGVDVAAVGHDETALTGTAIIMVDRAGEKQILVAPGANDRLTAEQVRAAAATVQAARVVLCQLEVPLGAVAEALRLARAAGARTMLDPAPAVVLADELLRLVDVIRPNASEAAVLTGVAVHDRASARQAADWLRGHGAGAAVVQAGDEGNLFAGPDGEHFVPKLPVPGVDATGAGDALAGALAVALAEGRSLAEAGPFASAAAALATTKVGAQEGLPRREQIAELLARAGYLG